jgi:DNA-binding CsgD family transcriptional regulator
MLSWPSSGSAPGSYFRSAALHVLEVAHLLAGNEGSLDATAAQVKERSDGEDPEAIRFRMRLAASLSPAELRLLPLLATHLSFREIGERLYISRSTVKTEAASAYRNCLPRREARRSSTPPNSVSSRRRPRQAPAARRQSRRSNSASSSWR